MKRFYFYLLKADHFWGFNAFLNKSNLKGKFSDNLGQKICRLFHFLAQFVFTTSKTELDYYHQKVNERVALRVAEPLKTYDLRKLGSLKKILEMFGFNGEYPAVHPKFEFWRFLLKNCKKSAVEHSTEKSILLNFVN